MGRMLLLPCDFKRKKEVLDFLDKFEGRKPLCKNWDGAFYSEGPEIVRN